MDNDIVKNNDPIQLQQIILFLRAELAKYKNEVKRLRDSDYFSLVLRVERENVQLIKQKKELSMELLKQKRDHKRKIKTYYDDIQAREIQKKKQLSSIENLLKELEELCAENKLIKETLKFTKDELLSMNSDAVQLIKQKKELSMELLKQKRNHERKIKTYYDDIQAREIQKKKQLSSIEGLLKELEELRAENKLIKETLKFTKDELLSMNSVDCFENKLNVFTRDISLQMKTIIEAIERSRLEQANSDNLNKHLSKEIEEKSSEIEKLSEELADVKKNNFSLSGKTMMNPEVLTHLDSQVNKVLAQSMDFEKQLNHKLCLLDDLDQKLNLLSIEINTDKTV
ncbi:MAG TPA: hypothetical protein VNU45_13120 [Rummeliibacillus sp.]|nr:hypothetical protein [Rummeliibacillus sp.]